MFLSRNKKNNVYPCKPQFYYIKVGFKGVKIIQACFRDETKKLLDCALIGVCAVIGSITVCLFFIYVRYSHFTTW